MKSNELKRALDVSVEAARKAGSLMRKNLFSPKHINEEYQHDIKLELDVRCQTLIEQHLRKRFPDISLFGEEGVSGDPNAEARWVVDPIDGTVNFTYGIPHACVSIALQEKVPGRQTSPVDEQFETIAGVVYDPFCDELWTAIRGQPARLNGRLIHSSKRTRLREALVSVGFAKNPENIERMMPILRHLLHRVRKVRITGSAALAMVYVASGRFDAYLEPGVRLWDIAAGGLILECAGGEFWRRPLPGEHVYELRVNNGFLRKKLERAFTQRTSRKRS